MKTKNTDFPLLTFFKDLEKINSMEIYVKGNITALNWGIQHNTNLLNHEGLTLEERCDLRDFIRKQEKEIEGFKNDLELIKKEKQNTIFIFN